MKASRRKANELDRLASGTDRDGNELPGGRVPRSKTTAGSRAALGNLQGAELARFTEYRASGMTIRAAFDKAKDGTDGKDTVVEIQDTPVD